MAELDMRMPVVLSHGTPDSTTPGWVGLLAMDVTQTSKPIYKCTAADNNKKVYAWKPIESGGGGSGGGGDYILTDADKTEIALAVSEMIDIPEVDTFDLEEVESDNINTSYDVQAEKIISAEQARRIWAVLDANATVRDSGVCGENLTWTLYSSGLLKISGTGRAYDYCKGVLIGKTRAEIESGIANGTIPADYGFQEGKTYDDAHGQYVAPWYKYRAEVFPNDYTSESAYNAENPNGWKYNRILVETGITYIGDWMFYRVCGVVELTIPEGVTSIGRWGVRYSPDLLQVTLPDSLTEIEEYGLSRMESLINIKFGNQLTTVGFGAFGGDACLPNIVLPDSLITTGTNIFEGSFALTRAKLGKVTSIPSRTFVGLTKFEYVDIPEEVTNIGEYAFYKTALKKIRIPANVTRIDDLAFYACERLVDVYIDSSVIASAMSGVHSCGHLYYYAHHIYIKDGLESVYADANWTYTGIVNGYKKYDNPNYVEPEEPDEPEEPVDIVASGNFGDNATYTVTRTDVEGEYAFKLTGTGEVKPDGAAADAPWYSYKNNIVSIEIDGAITGVRAGLFREYTNLRTAKLNITAVSNEMFAKCNNLTSVELIGVETIGATAFWLTALTEIIIPDSVTSIGTNAFLQVSTPTRVVIGKNVQTIGDSAFANIGSSAGLVIPQNNALTTIGSQNFMEPKCAGFGDLYLPNIATIGNSFMMYATGFTSVTIGSNITSIGVNAFGQMTSGTVTIQTAEANVTIGEGAFKKLPSGSLVFTG